MLFALFWHYNVPYISFIIFLLIILDVVLYTSNFEFLCFVCSWCNGEIRTHDVFKVLFTFHIFPCNCILLTSGEYMLCQYILLYCMNFQIKKSDLVFVGFICISVYLWCMFIRMDYDNWLCVNTTKLLAYMWDVWIVI